jgi:hypothetical protein
LRLPARIAEWYPTLADTTPTAIQRGLEYTYYLVSLLAVLEGLFLVVGLKLKSSPRTTSESEKVPLGERLKEVAQDLPVGFIVAWNEPEVALAYLSGFAVSLILLPVRIVLTEPHRHGLNPSSAVPSFHSSSTT